MVRRLHGSELRYGVGRRWHGTVRGHHWSFGQDDDGWFGRRKKEGLRGRERKIRCAPTLDRAVEAALALEVCGTADTFTVWEVRR